MKKISKLDHVVLIGLNFQLKRSTGDKNFWVDMIPILAADLKRITIISIRNNEIPNEKCTIGNCRILVRYLSPKLLGSSSSDSKKRRLFWKEGVFPAWLGVIEKTLNVKILLNELSSINSKHSFQHIHLMDNMGFVNSFLARSVKCPISVSAMSYQGKRPKWFYKLYLLMSYKINNLTVVPYSMAFADRLIAIGINKSCVHRIHWGVNVKDSKDVSEKSKIAAKKELGIPADMPLTLWAGYIQQISRADFLLAYKIAKKSRKQIVNSTFFFAFKPESFESEFTVLNKPEINIHVTPTSVETFKLLLNAADLFFSPVANDECILAPPLTWIEIMSRGVPILTTNVPGANEIIEIDSTGKIADQDKLVDEIQSFISNPVDFREQCLDKVHRDYNINNSAYHYLQLWSQGS